MTTELCNGCTTEAPFYKRDENCPGCAPPLLTKEQLARAAFIAEMAELAAEDVARTQKYNVSLNPFSTAGARHDWQQGYDNKPGQFPWDCEESYNRMWHRGRQARLLVDKIEKGEPCQLPDLS